MASLFQRATLYWLLCGLLLPWLAGAGEPEAVQMDSGPVKAYKQFAEAFVFGRLEEAALLAGSDKVRTILERKAKVNRKLGGARPISETLFMIIDQRSLAEGKVKLHAAQIIQYQEPEDEPPAFHRQFITLIPQGEGWLVEEFMDEEEECCK